MASLSRFAGLVLLAASVGACTTKKTEAPDPTGPSELATSLSLSATPNTIPQDGASESVIVIQARDANSQPFRNLSLRLDIAVGGVVTDFGTLSAKNVATGSDGRVTVTYRAPNAVDNVDRQTMVTINVTPQSGDAHGDITRTVQIRLVPSGTVGGESQVPDFTFSPAAPMLLESVVFDASDPQLDGTITKYQWDFGDGSTGSGRNPSHEYRDPGTFTVTLTVTDLAGLTGSRSKTISVTSDLPTADFVFSPSEPGIGEKVIFNGSTSTATSPRQIVKYEWQFGNGTTADGMIVSTKYEVAGTFNVTLTVTDDAGSEATTSQTVTVGTDSPGGLSPRFTFSPTDPTVGQTVNFNASTSTSSDPITEYRWDFGDGTVLAGSSPTRSHAYGTASTFIVTLRIKDSHGRTATTTEEVSVAP